MERYTYFENGKYRLMFDGVEYSNKFVDRLAHYEDLEEQGRLAELPCAVGDKVWSALDDIGRLHECEVASIHYGRKTHESYITLEPVSYRGREYGVSFGAIGKTVFLTRAEAEAALA